MPSGLENGFDLHLRSYAPFICLFYRISDGKSAIPGKAFCGATSLAVITLAFYVSIGINVLEGGKSLAELTFADVLFGCSSAIPPLCW